MLFPDEQEPAIQPEPEIAAQMSSETQSAPIITEKPPAELVETPLTPHEQEVCSSEAPPTYDEVTEAAAVSEAAAAASTEEASAALMSSSQEEMYRNMAVASSSSDKEATPEPTG